MIFWSGHGILIVPLVIIGFAVGGVAFGVVAALTGYDFGLATPLLAAAVAVFVYGKTMGRSGPHPKTGEPRKHTLYFLPANFWAVALLVGAGFALLEESQSNPGFKRDNSAPTASSPYRKAFDAADRKILSARDGVAHGNTETARSHARAFATAAKKLRELGIERAERKGMSLTDGEMVTYCHQTAASLVFMVHVPKLRKFSEEAKSFMMEAAWVSAQSVAAQLDPPPEELGVGIRGVVLYDQGWSGTIAEDPANDPFSGVTTKMDDSEAIQAMLARLFRSNSEKAKSKPADKGGNEQSSSTEELEAASDTQAPAR